MLVRWDLTWLTLRLEIYEMSMKYEGIGLCHLHLDPARDREEGEQRANSG